MDDLYSEQHYIQIVAWKSILEDRENAAARKVYEADLKLAIQQSEESQRQREEAATRSEGDKSIRVLSSSCSLDESERRNRTTTSTVTSDPVYEAELELAIKISGHDHALWLEEEERLREADEEMIASLSAFALDEEQGERQIRDEVFEAELELAIRQSEQQERSTFNYLGPFPS